jgi:hypothetical protein
VTSVGCIHLDEALATLAVHIYQFHLLKLLQRFAKFSVYFRMIHGLGS